MPLCHVPHPHLELKLPGNAPPDSVCALEPWTDAPRVRKLMAFQQWPLLTMDSSIPGKIHIPNITPEPHFLTSVRYMPSTNQKPAVSMQSCQSRHHPSHQFIRPAQNTANVCLNANNLLPHNIRAKFTSLLDEYHHIFNLYIKGCNSAEGLFEAKVSMGPMEPPQRKGRLPQYACHLLLELQQ